MTKPAGVAVQLLGGAALIAGIGMIAVSNGPGGMVLLVVGVALLWLGRQTRRQ